MGFFKRLCMYNEAGLHHLGACMILMSPMRYFLVVLSIDMSVCVFVSVLAGEIMHNGRTLLVSDTETTLEHLAHQQAAHHITQDTHFVEQVLLDSEEEEETESEENHHLREEDSPTSVERIHTCTDCGKTFSTSSGLKQHQHVHSSVKPFQCEVCFKAYTQFSNLCRHKRMHADCRQQIKCRECGQAFSTIHSLNKHKRYCESISRSRFYRFNNNNNNTAVGLAGPSMNGQPPAFAVRPQISSSASGSGNAITSNIGFGASTGGFGVHPMLHAAFPQMMNTSSPEFTAWYSSMMKLYSRDDRLGNKQALVSQSPLPNSSKTSPVKANPVSPLKTGSESDEENNNSNGSYEIDIDKKSKKTSSENSNKSGTNKVKLGNQYIFRPFADSDDEQEKKDVKEEKVIEGVKTLVKGEIPLDLSNHEKPQESDEPQPKTVKKMIGESKSGIAKYSGVTSAKLAIIKPMTSCLTAEKPPSSGIAVQSMSRKGQASDVPKVPSTTADVKIDQIRYIEYIKQSPASAISRQNELLLLRQAQLAELTSMTNWHIPEASRNFLKQNRDEYGNYLSRLKQLPVMHTPYSAFWGGAFAKHKYSCKFCGKVFPRSANLTRHLRTHTGEQPYKCKYCERSFSISSNLQRHIRNIHKKEKPYNCNLCGRSFGQQTNLDRHMRSHELQDVGCKNDDDIDADEISREHTICGNSVSTSSTCVVFPESQLCTSVNDDDEMCEDEDGEHSYSEMETEMV